VFSPKDEVTLQTPVLIDVTRPVTSYVYVWIKGDSVLSTSDDVLRIQRVSRGGPLAVVRRAEGAFYGDADRTGATLYVILNAETLVGAWRYAEPAPLHQHVLLPAVPPDRKQLAIARAVATTKAQYRDSTFDVDERIACAAISSPKIFDALNAYENASAEEGFEGYRQITKQEEAADERRTSAERAKARADQRDSADFTGFADGRRLSRLDQIRAAARKYKPGCLTALGVPQIAKVKKI
jgi:hypothetical protein